MKNVKEKYKRPEDTVGSGNYSIFGVKDVLGVVLLFFVFFHPRVTYPPFHRGSL